MARLATRSSGEKVKGCLMTWILKAFAFGMEIAAWAVVLTMLAKAPATGYLAVAARLSGAPFFFVSGAL